MNQVKYEFTSKVAFVTGASSGIGRATAIEFARQGASVVVVDVNEREAIHTMISIEEMAQKAIFIKCDISNSSEVMAAVEETIITFGFIDFAFNNAGIEGDQAMTADSTEENWDRVIAVNLKGVWLCMKHQIPVMLKQRGGSIVNCSSIAGMVAFQCAPAYVASKHGVIGLTKAAALEYAKSNIRVNAVCPGVIQTPMTDRFVNFDELARKELVDSEPMGRLGQPEEIAAAVMWLCSSHSSFVTGHNLVVDGGWVAQ